MVRANTTNKVGSTHIVPYDALLCILRDPLETVGLRGSDAPHFTASRVSADTTNEQLELILALLAICRATPVGSS